MAPEHGKDRPPDDATGDEAASSAASSAPPWPRVRGSRVRWLVLLPSFFPLLLFVAALIYMTYFWWIPRGHMPAP